MVKSSLRWFQRKVIVQGIVYHQIRYLKLLHKIILKVVLLGLFKFRSFLEVSKIHQVNFVS